MILRCLLIAALFPAALFQSQTFITISLFQDAACSQPLFGGSFGTFVYQVNLCGTTNGTSPFQKLTTTTVGTRTRAFLAEYPSSSCSGLGKPNINGTVGGACVAVGTLGGAFSMAYGRFVSTTAVAAPANTMGTYVYTTQAACNAGTTSSLFAASFVDASLAGTCTAPSPSTGTYTKTTCGPASVTAAATAGGGFMVKTYYTVAGCATTPTQVVFYQAGVCLATASGSLGGPQSSVVTAVSNQATGRVTFNATSYFGSLTCRCHACQSPPPTHTHIYI